MNLWNENRLIDIIGHADPALLEGDFPELVAGVAAGSLALTGVALLVGRKHEWMRHVQRAAGKNMHAA